MKIFKSPLQPDATDSAPISSFSTSHQQTLLLSAQHGSTSISETPLSRVSLTASSSLGRPESIVHQTESQQKSVRVLIVDDNEINLKVSSSQISAGNPCASRILCHLCRLAHVCATRSCLHSCANLAAIMRRP